MSNLNSPGWFRTAAAVAPGFRRKKASGPLKEKRSARARTNAAIFATWKKLRKDLRGDVDELRTQRLGFMAKVLNRPVVESSRDLTSKQLGRVLDAMRQLEREPELPGVQGIHSGTGVPPVIHAQDAHATAEVLHLATAAQVATIEKIFDHLSWGTKAREGYVEKRFKRTTPRMLTPQQANSLTMILLTIAASQSIRSRGVARVSRGMIREEIPRLKRELGIDRKQEADGSRQEHEEEWGDD